MPVGYSDGFRCVCVCSCVRSVCFGEPVDVLCRRGPKHVGEVLIHGQRCPIRGRVSMEKTVVSVQGLIDAGESVAIGDEVVLLGQAS